MPITPFDVWVDVPPPFIELHVDEEDNESVEVKKEAALIGDLYGQDQLKGKFPGFDLQDKDERDRLLVIHHKVLPHLGHLPAILFPEEYLGIEIEIENVKKLEAAQSTLFEYMWRFTHDGSLRNNGLELISWALPAEILVKALVFLNQFMLPKENLSFSERTSVHVHLNMRDSTFQELTSFLVVYLFCEGALFEFAGGARHRGIYCVPIQDTHLVEGLFEVVTCKRNFLENVRGLISDWEKYSALNLTRLADHAGKNGIGTVEFRHMPGTMDIPKLIHWINMICSLKAYSKKVDYKTLPTKLCQVQNLEGVAKEIFGEGSPILNLPELHNNLLKGQRVIRDMLNYGRYQNLRKEITKDSYISRMFAAKISKIPKTEEPPQFKWHIKEGQ